MATVAPAPVTPAACATSAWIDAQAAVEGEPLGDVDLHGLHVRRVPQARHVGGRHGRHEVRGARQGAGDGADATDRAGDRRVLDIES